MKQLPVEKHQMVIDNLPLVTWVVNGLHISPLDQDYDDYIQEGRIGLIHAVTVFDESKGFKFATFAVPTIRGFVQRYRREKTNLIRVSRNDYDVYIKATNLMLQGWSLDDIPDELGISPLKFNHLMNTYCVTSLNMEVDGKDDSAIEIGELVADWRNDYENMLYSMSFEEAFNKVLATVKKEPSKSICEEWFYSILFGEELTQKYFRDKYGLSQSYISRILIKFKQKLSFYLGMEI